MEESIRENFFFVDAAFNAPLLGFMSLRSLDFDLGFKNFSIDLGDVMATVEDGEPVQVDWTNVSEGVQVYFDTTWNEEVKPVLHQDLSCIIDTAISGCRNILGVPDCLALDGIDAACFPDQVTTTTPGTGTTPTTYTSPVTTPRPEEPDYVTCAGKQDGAYPHPFGCDMFYLCLNEVSSVHTCIEPYLFDPDLRVCNLPEFVYCPLTCNGNGVAPHPQFCSLYLVCNNGDSNVLQCPAPLLFDKLLLTCLPPETARC